MSENVTVAVRVRPTNETELRNNDECIWSIDPITSTSISLSPSCMCDFIEQGKVSGLSGVKFNFQSCMDNSTPNLTVFSSLVQPVVESFLEGINGTVIMYGPTGAGKTYTMIGDERTRKNLREVAETDFLEIAAKSPRNDEPGVLLYAIDHIFKKLEVGAKGINLVKVSYVEVYNDCIYDLLQEKTNLPTPLSVNEVGSGKFVLKGVVEQSVKNIAELLEAIKKGERNRHYAESVMNHNSSRSHTIFQVKLRKMSSDTTSKSEINFVDLAGSEKCSSFSVNFAEDRLKGWQFDEMQGKAKERIKEGQYINKSLFFLTQVINRKVAGGEAISHVPYRNTSLTKLLKSSLGGNSKTCVILCLSPVKSQFEHSLQTLKFGMSVSRVENKTVRNVTKTNSEETLKLLIAEYQARLASLEGAAIPPLSANNELKAENDMLWQQFVSADPSPKAPLTIPREFSEDLPKQKVFLQFYVDEDLIKCNNDPKQDTEVAQNFIEALKLSCKHACYWKAKAQGLEKRLNDTLSRISQLKAEISARNLYIINLVEVAGDCLKALKSQTAKLEIYECTEKWAQQLSNKNLTALAAHFKVKLEQVQEIIAKNGKGSIGKKDPPKLELKLKRDEVYISNLLKEGKNLTETPEDSVTNNEEGDVNIALSENEDNKKLLQLIQSIKELLPRPAPPKPKPTFFTQSCRSDPKLSPVSSGRYFRGRSPVHKQTKVSCKTPNAKKSGISVFECNPPRQRTAAKAESRSTSSSSRQQQQNKKNGDYIKLGNMINQAIKAAGMQKPSVTPRGATPDYLPKPRANTESYEMGAFSHAQSMRQLMKGLQPHNVDIGTSPKGELLRSWHKMIGEIGFK